MKAQIVSFHCVLKDALGTVLSTTFNQDVITQISADAQEIPGLAARMTELETGEHRRISVPAKEAYGLYDTKLTQHISLEQLASAATPAVGDQIHHHDARGSLRAFRVTEIAGDTIHLDANHPLAGQDLVFELHVLEARDATSEEIFESVPPALPKHFH